MSFYTLQKVQNALPMIVTAHLSRRCFASAHISRSHHDSAWEAAVDQFRSAQSDLSRSISHANLRLHSGALGAMHSQLKLKAQEVGGMVDLAGEMNDADLKRHLIGADIKDLCDEVGRFRISWLLQSKDDADVAVTITAGAGGVDSCDWTQMLAGMYSRWAASKKFKFAFISTTGGDPTGYMNAAFTITGAFAYSWLQGETGVHRLVRISPFDSKGKRHTSFASVLVYPLAKIQPGVGSPRGNKVADIPAKDIRVDTFKSSGPGGQHVNKTESAVRVTHMPTGIVVECKTGRSQIQNKAVCMDLLCARLKKMENDKRQQLKADERERLPENAWGSQVRSYVLQPYQLVKDNRSGHSTSQISAVLKGDIDEFLIAQLDTDKNGQKYSL